MELELGTAKFGHFAENADTNPDFWLLVFETVLSLTLGKWACRPACDTCPRLCCTNLMMGFTL
ncbi:MAG: hypothetical protein HRU33_19690 [Rhodobacteraceae bacterium]|nr:hypothetical protein [Paracoccaceae bacterium]